MGDRASFALGGYTVYSVMATCYLNVSYPFCSLPQSYLIFFYAASQIYDERSLADKNFLFIFF